MRLENAAAHAQTRQSVTELRHETQQSFGDLRQETQQSFDGLRGETQQSFGELRGETRQLVDELRQETRQSFGELRDENAADRLRNLEMHEETRRHVNVVNEATRSEVRLLAETVAHLDAKLDSRTTELADKIEQSAAETRALFRFSHSELDVRVRTLEEGFRTLTGQRRNK